MKDVFSLFIEDLTILDCAIWHPARGAIGYSWTVGIEFIGATTGEGVVFDFSLAKKFAKKVIDETADHGFIVPKKYTHKMSDTHLIFAKDDFTYSAPEHAFYVLDTVSTESIATHLQEKILKKCQEEKDCGSLDSVVIYLKSEHDLNQKYFNYIHGLKQHYGNCQRLIHGHRSTLKVWINESRHSGYESHLIELFHDKQLAIHENATFNESGTECELKYTSKQGEFRATIDPRKVLIMPYETTIENISKFAATTLKNDFKELKNSVVTVAVYEGIGKGSKFTLDQTYQTAKLEQKLMEETCHTF